MRKSTCLLLAVIFLWQYATAQLKDQLQSINLELAASLEKGDVQKLMSYYDDSAICMPEYHASLYRKQDVQHFYGERFKTTVIADYVKKIFEVAVFGNYVTEIGTFTSTLAKRGKAPVLYNGKYFNVWKKGKDGLKIVSEVWGSTSYIDRSLLFDSTEHYASGWMPPLKVDALTKEIMGSNQQITKAVLGRDAKGQYELFTEDAIYMPYYDTLYLGKEKIARYFEEHYAPEVNTDSLNILTSRTIDLGNFVIEYGYYSVVWSAGKDRGRLTGKSTNLWKRDKKGWLRYRQLVTHD